METDEESEGSSWSDSAEGRMMGSRRRSGRREVA